MATLTRTMILAAAQRWVDEHGLSSLSMRKLANALGVGTMSLYNHVEDKADVVYGITEQVAAELVLPGPGDPREELRGCMLAMHGLLLSHPWACETMGGETPLGPHRMAFYDAVLGTLRRAGCSVPEARRGFLALDAHVLGFARQQAGFPDDPEASRTNATAFLATLDPVVHPSFHEAIQDVVGTGDYGFPFAFVLDAILDALLPPWRPS